MSSAVCGAGSWCSCVVLFALRLLHARAGAGALGRAGAATAAAGGSSARLGVSSLRGTPVGARRAGVRHGAEAARKSLTRLKPPTWRAKCRRVTPTEQR